MNTLDVRDYLEDGERLLWESKPSDGKLFTIGLVFYNAERIDEAVRLLEKMSRQ